MKEGDTVKIIAPNSLCYAEIGKIRRIWNTDHGNFYVIEFEGKEEMEGFYEGEFQLWNS